tara:strand:+ start:118 stop:540 length:423 start_codon:yes stop_codon:yes gene_type:complete
MRRILIIVLLTGIAACNSSKLNNIEVTKEAYILEYKKAVIYGCINEATNGNFSKFSSDNNDLGLAGVVAVLYHSETERAINLGKELSNNIEAIDYMDYNGNKPIFDNCISFAFSKRVDSLAAKEYEMFLKYEGRLFYEKE